MVATVLRPPIYLEPNAKALTRSLYVLIWPAPRIKAIPGRLGADHAPRPSRSARIDWLHVAGEDISDAAHALDYPRFLARSLDLAAQSRHMPVDHAIEWRPIVALQHLRDFITRQNTARMLQKQFEDPKLGL